MTEVQRVLVFTGANNSSQLFDDICETVGKFLDSERYHIDRLTSEDIREKDWANGAAAVIVNNDKGDQNIDEATRKALINYFLNSGKLLLLCDPADGRKALWLLHDAVGDFPDAVGSAFEKFARRLPVPTNLQAVRLHKSEKDISNISDYSLGLIRGDSDLSYMYLSCEDGDTAVFAVSNLCTGETMFHDKSRQKSQIFWRDVLGVLRLIGVDVLPVTADQMAGKAVDTADVSELIVYTDRINVAAEFVATLPRLIVSERFNVRSINREELFSKTWQKNCAVLFVDNRRWTERLNGECRQIIAEYFANSGKVVFFCEPEEGRKAMWLLKMMVDERSNPVEWPESVGKAYEYFAKNEPIPTDLQAVQFQKKDADRLTDLSLGLIKGANGAFTYLKCEDGDTAVFVAMRIEDVLQKGGFIWSDLLRVVDVPTALQFNPMPAKPSAVAGELTRIVKFINTGAADASSTVSAFVGDMQDRIAKFFKGDGQSGKSGAKPPNVLLFAGDDRSKFEAMQKTVRDYLATDSYTVYELKRQQVLDATPWMSNCTCLMVDADAVEPDGDRLKSAFRKYFFRNHGHLMVFVQPSHCRQGFWLLDELDDKQIGQSIFDIYEQFVRTGERLVPKNLENVRLNGEQFSVAFGGSCRGSPAQLHLIGGKQAAILVGSPWSMAVNDGESTWKEIFETIGMHGRDMKVEAPATSAEIYVMCQNTEIETGLKSALGDSPFKHDSHQAQIADSPANAYFDKESFFKSLHTKRLGKVVLYTAVTHTTMDISDEWHTRFGKDNYVVIAGQQTLGQGRGGNQWLSPPGSASFSFSMHIQQTTTLGKHLSFLQHLVTLAAAETLNSMNKSLNVRIKWPNDIYHGSDTKVGGVLVKATFVNQEFVVFVGVGINVANQAPTVCLNQFLPAGSEQLTIPAVIAGTLGRLEQLIEEFQQKGSDAILPEYYKHWLHSDQEVSIVGKTDRVTVVGLDAYGFLNVKDKATGELLTLHPDGNSFDMMANLIQSKPVKE